MTHAAFVGIGLRPAMAPNLLILSSHQAFRVDRLYVVPAHHENPHQRNGDIFVGFDLHPTTGVTWMGTSSWAEAAANAMAARR
jgi:hypothetical protein